MNVVHSFSRLLSVKISLVVCLLLASAVPSLAQRVKNGRDTLDLLSYERPELRLTSQSQEINEIRGELTGTPATRVLSDLDAFTTQTGRAWIIEFDRVTGNAALLEGGLPWIPGAGNDLDGTDVGVSEERAAHNQVPVEVVAEKAVQLLRAYPGLLGADPADLRLRPEASGPYSDYLYYLWFDWTYRGIPVERANVVFRLNSGNLVQFGQEYISDAIHKLNPEPLISNETAWQNLWGYLGGTGSDDKIIQPGRLVILPISTSEALSGAAVAPGTGLEYRLVYILDFHRPGVIGNWEAKVDAHSGEILSFRDTNEYGHIQGGVYKTDKPYVASNPPSYSGPQTESSMPFPYADYGGSTYADAAGNFTGTTGTSTLTGRVGSAGNVGGVDISDVCGSISLGATGGLIDFGTHANTSTDCTTPGIGGVGNTHSARTQYWNITQIKIKAYTYLPTNSWLQGRVVDTVNVNDVCNAYWGGGSLHFFKSGRYTSGSFWMDCNNTGELPGVSLHEFGHGMDSNDGNSSSPDYGTGETYGDITAILQTHQSCAGGGFIQNISSGSTKCGYGTDACNACTGVRDVDYGQHTPATAATPTNYAGNSSVCPTSSTGYIGPCGREGHCESAVSSQAMWDLAVRDLTAPPYSLDSATAWQLTDKLWYLSRPTASGAFTCNKNGNDGCATNSYYKALRVADDCDGDLTNGTPHAGAIWAAFNRHGIGCSTDVRTDDACPSCPPLTAPTLGGTAGNNQNNLTWSAVAGATSYDVLRNETGCTAGFTKIANMATTTYTDTMAVNGVTYYYTTQAKASGSCPASPLSNCVVLTPSPCTTPGVPTIGTVTVSGLNQLTVSWSAGSPAGATYNIYRVAGTPACPASGYSLVKSGQASSPWIDTTVSGLTTYSYKVSAVDSTGGCESAQSGCASATATGTCTAAPTFAGITGIANPQGATCTLNLSWSAGTSNCSGSLSYSVYRSTSYPFTPAVGNRIASGLAGTSHSDSAGLVSGTTYYYIVRAVDSTNGSEDANLVAQSGVPTGLVTTGTWTDDGGDTGTAKLTVQSTWTNAAAGGRTAPKCYATGTYADGVCISATTPTLNIGTGGGTLTFWSKYDIETGWDKGLVELSTNGGANFNRLEVTTYPDTSTRAADSCGFPASVTYFSRTITTPAYATYTATIPAGSAIQVRWRLSTDSCMTTNGMVD